MKKGFTILELLVASLLLGMLVTILTMLFNQSSVAWRTGIAGQSQLDKARENIAEVREEADNIYIWNGQARRIVGLWEDNGGILRERAWDVNCANASETGYLRSNLSVSERPTLSDFTGPPLTVGEDGSNGKVEPYIVNVKSAGPNGIMGDWDDIWSYPYEISN